MKNKNKFYLNYDTYCCTLTIGENNNVKNLQKKKGKTLG